MTESAGLFSVQSTSPPSSEEGKSFRRKLSRRFSQPILDSGDGQRRRSSLQDLLGDQGKETSSERSATSVTEIKTPERPSLRSRAKLNLSTLITTSLNSSVDCPHSAPVVETQPVVNKQSSHRRHFSILSLGAGQRPNAASFDTSPGNSPSTAGRSPMSAGAGRVVGRLSSLLKKECSFNAEDIEMSPPSDLELLLLDSVQRNELVDDLLSNHDREASLAVRFIGGVNQWRGTVDARDRKARGRKLVSVFFDPASQYFLSYLPKDIVASVRDDHDALDRAKDHILQKLEGNEHVINFMAESKTEHPYLRIGRSSDEVIAI